MESSFLGTVEILYKTPWISLRRIVSKERGIDGFDFIHEDRCDGMIVSILPFRIEHGRHEVLLRSEVTPCWDVEHKMISSITGGVDDGDTPLGCAIKELEEEGGYKVAPQQMIPLGIVFGAKSADTRYHLFSVDLTWAKRGEAKGDGSLLEGQAECFWTTHVTDAVDPMVYASLVRLASQRGELGINLGQLM